MTYHASTGTNCFGEALIVLKRGGMVRRSGWRPNLYVRQSEDIFSNGPSLNLEADFAVTGLPWKPSDEDLLAEDWVEHFKAT